MDWRRCSNSRRARLRGDGMVGCGVMNSMARLLLVDVVVSSSSSLS